MYSFQYSTKGDLDWSGFLRALSECTGMWAIVLMAFGLVGWFPPALAQQAGRVISAPDRFALERFSKVNDYFRLRIDQSIYDPDKLAEKLGRDPEKIAAFIRSSIAYRPYRGALKGAKGVLIDRTGNSLDQALLAYHLLRHHTKDIRIGRTVLSDRQVALMMDYARKPIPSAPSTYQLSAADLAVLLNEGGLTANQLRTIQNKLTKEQKSVNAEWKKHVSLLQKKVAPLLQKVGISEASIKTDYIPSKIAKDHFHIEFRQNSESWQVLSLAPGLDDVQGFGRKAIYYKNFSELPANLIPRVRAEAILVFGEGAKSSEKSLGVVEMRTPFAVEQQMIIRFSPEPISQNALTTQDLYGAQDGYPKTMRLVMVGEKGAIVQRRFGPDGTDTKSDVGEGFKGAGHALSILTERMSQQGRKQKPKATGLLIRYTIKDSQGAGNKPVSFSTERWIVDLTGQQRGAPLSSFLDLWIGKVNIIPYRMNSAYLDTNLRVATHEAIKTSINFATEGVAGGLPKGGGNHLATSGLVVAALAFDTIENRTNCTSEETTCTYVTRPTIIAEETIIKHGNQGGATGKVGIDLLQISGRSSVELQGVSQLQQSLIWTAAEHSITDAISVKHDNRVVAMDSFFSRLTNPSNRDEDLDVRLVENHNSALQLTGNSSIRTNRAIVSIGSKQKDKNPLTIDIDLARGQAIGRLPGGRGQATTEQKILIADRVMTVVEFVECYARDFKNSLDRRRLEGQPDYGDPKSYGAFMCLYYAGVSWFGALEPALLALSAGPQFAECLTLGGDLKYCTTVILGSLVLRHATHFSIHAKASNVFTKRKSLIALAFLSNAFRATVAGKSGYDTFVKD